MKAALSLRREGGSDPVPRLRYLDNIAPFFGLASKIWYLDGSDGVAKLLFSSTRHPVEIQPKRRKERGRSKY